MSQVANTINPLVMGIDFGTESCRVSIFDIGGYPISFASSPYQTYHPNPGWAEQHPSHWWRALTVASRKALNKAQINPQKITGLSYDATSMTVVPADKHGNALRPAIMWMDVRATDQAARASQITHPARRYNGGGTMPATAEWFPFKAAWLKENEPDIYQQAHRIVDAPDWINYQLTNTWTTNINSAALRMYYDRDQGGWPVSFYDHIGVADVFSKIPETILDLGIQVGELTTRAAKDLGICPGIPVAQGCIDAWAGQIGLGVVKPGKMALITGSSHIITGQSAVQFCGKGFFGGYTDGVVKGQWTIEGGQSSTGSVLKWFKDNFAQTITSEANKTGANPYQILDEAAKQIPIGSDGLIINEYWQGNRTPYTDSKARGTITGLTLHHTMPHIYRAIEEAVCYGTAHNLQVMIDAGMQIKHILACGGATKSRMWMQMHCDVTGIPITLTKVSDAVVLGSCILAAVGAQHYPDLVTAAEAMVHEAETLEPDLKNHEKYQFYFDRYRQIYPAVQDQIHAVADHLKPN